MFIDTFCVRNVCDSKLLSDLIEHPFDSYISEIEHPYDRYISYLCQDTFFELNYHTCLTVIMTTACATSSISNISRQAFLNLYTTRTVMVTLQHLFNI